jgi:hypothetical protein
MVGDYSVNRFFFCRQRDGGCRIGRKSAVVSDSRPRRFRQTVAQPWLFGLRNIQGCMQQLSQFRQIEPRVILSMRLCCVGCDEVQAVTTDRPHYWLHMRTMILSPACRLCQLIRSHQEKGQNAPLVCNIACFSCSAQKGSMQGQPCEAHPQCYHMYK